MIQALDQMILWFESGPAFEPNINKNLTSGLLSQIRPIKSQDLQNLTLSLIDIPSVCISLVAPQNVLKKTPKFGCFQFKIEHNDG